MANWWEDNDLNNAIAEAEKDDREGPNTVVVMSVTEKEWEPGRTSYNCKLQIETAGFREMYHDFSAPSTPNDLRQAKENAKSTDSRRRVNGMVYHTRNAQKLAAEYGLENVADIAPGFRFAAKLYKNKKGYIKIDEILPKSQMAGETVAPSATVPF